MTETTETTTTTEATTTATEQPKKIEFSTEQSEWISKKIAAELKSDREKRELAEADAKKKAEADRERKAAEERGEFDQVKTSLEQERDGVAGERDRLKSENETYASIFEAQYEEDVKSIDEHVWAELKPADDAPLAERISALKKAKKLTGLVKATESTTRGNGQNPSPSGGARAEAKSPIPMNRMM